MLLGQNKDLYILICTIPCPEQGIIDLQFKIPWPEKKIEDSIESIISWSETFVLASNL